MRKFGLFLLLCCVINIAQAAIYPMPHQGNDIIGHIFTVQIQQGGSLDKLCKKYEVSFHELLEANPKIHPKRLRLGDSIVIPTEFILPKYRQGIVINIPELRLYYFTPDGNYVFTTPVGLGRSGWRTPTMVTKIYSKVKNPTWHVPEEIINEAAKHGIFLPDNVPPGPDNPLGKYALYLARNGFLIHGTNDTNSVGKYFSSGCIRLYNNAIKSLYDMVTTGTKVYILHHANKAGWLNGRLYLESHVPVSNTEPASNLNTQDPMAVIEAEAAKHSVHIDWATVKHIAKQQLGVPEQVGTEQYNSNYGILFN
jgi:L,D-transpeptidase ErfK/SrfK